MTNLIVVAIDIEARGSGAVRHGLISIGVCVGRGDRDQVIEKRRFDFLPYPNQSMELRAYNEFWVNHQDKLGLMQKNAKPPAEQIYAFRSYIDALEAKGPLYIVADNPAFDFGFINFYLDNHGLQSLNYTREMQYRKVHDADSYARGRMRMGFDNQWMSNADLIKFLGIDLDPEAHDHMPENDAELIYRLHYHASTK